jgi:hypothetical protein
MANKTLHPYKGHHAAEVRAFESGTDPDTMAPEQVWEGIVTASDVNGEHATRSLVITLGGTPADDDYTIVFSLDGAEQATVTTTRTDDDPETFEDLAEQIAVNVLDEDNLDGVIISANTQGDSVILSFAQGAMITAETTSPAGTTMGVTVTTSIVLSDLQPFDAFPANALRGEGPVLRVLEAFPAGSTATVDDASVGVSTVLDGVVVDGLGWAGGGASDVGAAHKVERSWNPRITIATTDPPTTGVLKVQVTASPLPE